MEELFNFGDAIKALKNGKRVAKFGWNEDVFLQLQVPDENSKMTAEYIYVESRFGRVPWVATQIEILADDWRIL